MTTFSDEIVCIISGICKTKKRPVTYGEIYDLLPHENKNTVSRKIRKLVEEGRLKKEGNGFVVSDQCLQPPLNSWIKA